MSATPELLVPRALCGPTGRHEGESLLVSDGIITARGPADLIDPDCKAQRRDLFDVVLAPGLTDLQVNGAFGHHLSDEPEALWEVARGLTQFGVTQFLPTMITAPLANYERALAVLQAGPPAGWTGAQPLGWHFEGPFLNRRKVGVHNPEWLQAPEAHCVRSWTRANGVALVTLAPELDGADAVIERLLSNDVVVSAGHSLATASEAAHAFDLGVTAVTHLFNAMPSIHHRDPGLVVEALRDERVFLGLIPDGIHVDPGLVDLVWRIAGPERICAVSDAMSALGMPPGKYTMGPDTITVDERSARRDEGTLAGSVLKLGEGLHNLMTWCKAPSERAVMTATSTPSRLIGVPSPSLSIGEAAHFVTLPA